MKKSLIFRGVATALVTPFDEKGIDYVAFAKIIEYQLTHGVDALVFCGTTGEASTLSGEEKKEVMDFAVKQTRKRVPVIIGTGANDTKKACELSSFAASVGADGLLVVTPYYNKCTQKGLVDYYNSIGQSSNLPFIIYNVPSRTGVTVLPETAQEISQNPLCAGIKDAGDSISSTAKTISLCGESLPVYSGNDDRILPVLSLGGKGAISVLSNIFPLETKKLCNYYFEGETERASKLQATLIPVINALFSEVNPIPVKTAMAEMGFCKNILRPPLTNMSKSNFDKMMEVINKL